MLRMKMSCVAPLVIPYFSTLSHIWNDIRKDVVEHKMCVLIFSKIFVRNISHSRKNRASERDIKVHRSSCKVSVILVRFL